MDFGSLDTAVRALFTAGLAFSTQAAYRIRSQQFLVFCETYHATQPFPVSEKVLSDFAAHLHEADLVPETTRA